MPNDTVPTVRDNAHLRSEEVQDIIGQPPVWLVRWGLLVFFLIIVMLLLLSWIIKFPDIVNSTFRLTSVNSPKPVNAKTDGKLVQLFVHNSSHIEKGEIIGYIESTADPVQVFELLNSLNKILLKVDSNDFYNISRIQLKDYNKLGEIQLSYQTFNMSLLQLKSFLKKGFYTEKRNLLYKDLRELEALKKNMTVQREIAERDYSLSSDEFKVQKELAEQKVIAPLEIKREESKFLAKQSALQQTVSTILNNEKDLNNKNKEIIELDKLMEEQQSSFLQALKTLKSDIETWKLKFVLTAPLSGKIAFSTTIQENQYVTTNQELFYVTPQNVSYQGEMLVPQFNLGKVRTGQKVLIKFNSYPFAEYGIVMGEVGFIADIPDRTNNYLLKVVLKNGNKTTLNKTLSFREGMTAEGQIITADKRLIEKFFYRLTESLTQKSDIERNDNN